jgi:predicted nucleic acid-binding protein
MPSAELFLDSSALVAGIISPNGGARALLLLAEIGLISIVVSVQVVAETERALARKAPEALAYFRQALKLVVDRIRRDLRPQEVRRHQDIIQHKTDVPIVVAAMKAGVDYLVTHNRRHFIDEPRVAERSGLNIGTPGDALDWLRSRGVIRENK